MKVIGMLDLNGAPFAPEVARLAEESACCDRCPLFARANHVVFGEGPTHLRSCSLASSQGIRRTAAAGPLSDPRAALDAGLRDSGWARSQSYVTNVVKHFKWEPQGKRRLHKHPSRYEIEQCRWWLHKEMLAVDPKLVVALGAFAASALMKPPVVLHRERPKLLRCSDGRSGLATIHPAAVLRAPDGAARTLMLEEFIADLRVVGSLAA
jgi:uracil-DNA glycosylase